jgi:hypothetical protein
VEELREEAGRIQAELAVAEREWQERAIARSRVGEVLAPADETGRDHARADLTVPAAEKQSGKTAPAPEAAKSQVPVWGVACAVACSVGIYERYPPEHAAAEVPERVRTSRRCVCREGLNLSDVSVATCGGGISRNWQRAQISIRARRATTADTLRADVKARHSSACSPVRDTPDQLAGEPSDTNRITHRQPKERIHDIHRRFSGGRGPHADDGSCRKRDAAAGR